MHIHKQRLLTPGPTPLYPPALYAMMASDIHHRTEEFRTLYRACLADLKEVMGTANDVLMFAASGTGAMDAAVSNLFSRGDRVIVCSAGKFGERWAEIAKAYATLESLTGNPMVRLNRAVAVAMVEGPASGLALLEGLELHDSHRLHAVRAHLYEDIGDLAAPAQCYAAAAARTDNARERDYLVEQAARVSAR